MKLVEIGDFDFWLLLRAVGQKKPNKIKIIKHFLEGVSDVHGNLTKILFLFHLDFQ